MTKRQMLPITFWADVFPFVVTRLPSEYAAGIMPAGKVKSNCMLATPVAPGDKVIGINTDVPAGAVALPTVRVGDVVGAVTVRIAGLDCAVPPLLETFTRYMKPL